jgi:hypothetical protein
VGGRGKREVKIFVSIVASTARVTPREHNALVLGFDFPTKLKKDTQSTSQRASNPTLKSGKAAHYGNEPQPKYK